MGWNRGNIRCIIFLSPILPGPYSARYVPSHPPKSPLSLGGHLTDNGPPTLAWCTVVTQLASKCNFCTLDTISPQWFFILNKHSWWTLKSSHNELGFGSIEGNPYRNPNPKHVKSNQRAVGHGHIIYFTYTPVCSTHHHYSFNSFPPRSSSTPFTTFFRVPIVMVPSLFISSFSSLSVNTRNRLFSKLLLHTQGFPLSAFSSSLIFPFPQQKINFDVVHHRWSQCRCIAPLGAQIQASF